jgi:long-chain acyl-CoA synthetase
MLTYDLPPLTDADPNSNITDLLVNRVAKTPDLALYEKQNSDSSWSPVSAKEFLEQVRALAKGFIAAGIQPGQAVAIMSHTSYEWTLTDFAIWFAGGVSVPIYETSSPAQMSWILTDSQSVAIFLEDESLVPKLDEIRDQSAFLRQVWRFDDDSLETLMKQGKDISDQVLEDRRRAAKLDDLATIIYTSGTTGKPKGCELLHRGFVDLSLNAKLELPEVVKDGNSTLLFLPLAHVFARFIEVLCVHAGVKVGHQGDVKSLATAMQTFHPDFLLAVPRVFEKVYNTAEQKAEANGKGDLFRKAAAIAVSYSEAMDTKSGPGLALRLKFMLFDRLIFSKLRDAMGGKVRYAVSGGAPLGVRLGHFYRAIGLIVLEGYGLTETTAPASIGRPESIRIGKVGRLLPGVGIKIAEDGEVLLRGSNVMRGYWQNPAATAEAIQDGWFHTGDIGAIDDDGFISITGRKKELIVTAGGKNVAPAPMEDPLRADPLIGQAIVIGDNRPFVAAIISLDPEMLPIWLASHGLDKNLTLEQATQSPQVISAVQAAVDRVNKTVSQAEEIKKFVIVDQELSEASGHLTPSLKIKRNAVMTDFAHEVEKIYGVERGL